MQKPPFILLHQATDGQVVPINLDHVCFFLPGPPEPESIVEKMRVQVMEHTKTRVFFISNYISVR